MTKLLTNNYKLNLASQLLESISETANNIYYLFVSEHVARDANTVPTPVDKIQTVLNDAYRNMVFGKKIRPSDASLAIRNVPYELNKVFAMYDDDVDLTEEDFYCIVDETSYFHVYKCLDNNLGANSTVEPQFAYVGGANNYVFQTADGYKWKYMYTVSDLTADYLSTEYYFPVVSNTTVEADAFRGAIDVISIDGEGKGYHNYLSGTFSGADIRVNGDNLLYKISGNNISYANGFYTGCLLYLATGTGAGQYQTITDYFSNGNGNFIEIANGFSSGPVNGTGYEITPEVIITGSGTDVVNAYARALINANASNSVYRVEMLEIGANYSYATANVIANAVVSVENVALVRPIYGPHGGHGANSASELLSDVVVFATRYANSEANTILTTNKYQQIGLLKDPKFANVVIQLANATGTFLEGELVVAIDPIRINTNVNINTTSAVISCESLTLSNVIITSGGTGGSYIPGETLTANGGTPIINATMNVVATEVRTVTIANTGTLYTNGSTISLTGGTGTNATFTVTTNTTGGPTALAIVSRGYYTANPTLTNTATTSSDSGTGLRVDVTTRVANVAILNAGAYTVEPSTSANNRVIGGSGTGAEFALDFDTTILADFSNQVEAGEYVYLTNKEGSDHQLGLISSVSNATHFTLTVNGAFACSQALLFQPHIIVNSEVYVVPNSTHLQLKNVTGAISTNTIIIGTSTGAKAVVNAVSRNGDEKSFETYIGLYKYDIGISSGAFEQDEQVYQGTSLSNSTANAFVHSVIDVSGQKLMYTSNQNGLFVNTASLVGANSGAIATINSQWSPELEFGSGDVLYLENIEAVSRSNSQTEQFKLIFEL
jgi:hypothetical protein